MSTQNQYVPAGSYQRTSQQITITLNALCEQTGGNWVQSAPLTFTADEANSFNDIANIEGTLTISPGNGSTPNPSGQQNAYTPAGSYQRTSQQITITLNALCEQTGGNWVQSAPLTFTATDANSFNDIANIEGTLTISK